MEEITKAEMRQRLGNISQLRDLLFGEKIEEYEYKVKQHDQKVSQLELDHQEFKTNIKKHLEQLEDKLLCRIDAIADSQEKRIQYINSTSQEERKKISQELKEISQYIYSNINLLQNTIGDRDNSLKLQITQSKADTDKNLQLLKRQILEKLESSLAELSTTKLSRNDLAEVMFELCLKLKEPNVEVELIDSRPPKTIAKTKASSNGDLVIPEIK